MAENNSGHVPTSDENDFVQVQTPEGTRYIHRGEMYIRSQRNIHIYHCVLRSNEQPCAAAASKIDDGPVTIIPAHDSIDGTGHSHTAVPLLLRRCLLIQDILNMARITNMPFHSIIQQISAR